MGKKILTIYAYKISLSGSISFKYMYAFHIDACKEICASMYGTKPLPLEIIADICSYGQPNYICRARIQTALSEGVQLQI